MMGLVFGPSLVILWRINITYGSWNNISNFETASHKTVMTTYGVKKKKGSGQFDGAMVPIFFVRIFWCGRRRVKISMAHASISVFLLFYAGSGSGVVQKAASGAVAR